MWGLGTCLTVEILEVGQLDSLSHSEDIRSSTSTVDQHPEIAGVESGNSASTRRSADGMGDISPRSNNGAKDHETEGEEGEAANGASKP